MCPVRGIQNDVVSAVDPRGTVRNIDRTGGFESPEGFPRQVSAVEHIRRMAGGSQSHLLRCSDGDYYVVKFPNNPQGMRTLACDLLGTLLATEMGLPAQPARVINVSESLIRNTSDLVIQLASGSTPCAAGKCFGSCFPVAKRRPSLVLAMAIDFYCEPGRMAVRNPSDAAGILVFDQWTCNTDARQLLFWRKFSERMWNLSMIDQGACFNGSRWNFPDSPLWGLHHGIAAYILGGKVA